MSDDRYRIVAATLVAVEALCAQAEARGVYDEYYCLVPTDDLRAVLAMGLAKTRGDDRAEAAEREVARLTDESEARLNALIAVRAERDQLQRQVRWRTADAQAGIAGVHAMRDERDALAKVIEQVRVECDGIDGHLPASYLKRRVLKVLPKVGGS